jgi:hypothetical protein
LAYRVAAEDSATYSCHHGAGLGNPADTATNNAVEAMPDNGRLTIGTEIGVVDIALAECRQLTPGSYATMTVSDSGCGGPLACSETKNVNRKPETPIRILLVADENACGR